MLTIKIYIEAFKMPEFSVDVCIIQKNTFTQMVDYAVSIELALLFYTILFYKLQAVAPLKEKHSNVPVFVQILNKGPFRFISLSYTPSYGITFPLYET